MYSIHHAEHIASLDDVCIVYLGLLLVAQESEGVAQRSPGEEEWTSTDISQKSRGRGGDVCGLQR